MGTERRTTLSLLKEQNECLYYALVPMGYIERGAVFEKALTDALVSRNDARGVEYFNFLKHAVYDALCEPYANTRTETSYRLEETEETIHALQAAQSECAHIAIKILRETYAHYLAQCRTISGQMLKEVAHCWRDTSSEDEADEMLAFLRQVGVDIVNIFAEEKLYNALREATDKRFPQARLVRHLHMLTSDPAAAKSDETIARILAIAWVRNQDAKELARDARALEPLRGASIAAHNLHSDLVAKIADLECAANELLKIMEKGDPVPGDKSVTYDGIGKIALLVRLSSIEKELSQEDLKAYVKVVYEHVGRCLRRWQIYYSTFPAYLVFVRVEATNQKHSSSYESRGFNYWSKETSSN